MTLLRDEPRTASVTHSDRTLGWTVALTVVVAIGAIAAILLHRNGHNQGDDFALYLRQARSIFDGDPAQAPEYDAATELAVRHFQQVRGLSVDGRVGDETYRALNEARWSLGDRLLRYDPEHPARGDDVRRLQELLLELGYDAGRADGILDTSFAGVGVFPIENIAKGIDIAYDRVHLSDDGQGHFAESLAAVLT